MTRCLIQRRTAKTKFDRTLCAGDLVAFDDGSRMIVVTVARVQVGHRFGRRHGRLFAPVARGGGGMTEMTYGLMQGRYPAIVRSYDQVRCTVNTRPNSKSFRAIRCGLPSLAATRATRSLRATETPRQGTRLIGAATTTKTTNSSATKSFGSWSGTRSFSSIPTRSRGRLRRP